MKHMTESVISPDKFIGSSYKFDDKISSVGYSSCQNCREEGYVYFFSNVSFCSLPDSFHLCSKCRKYVEYDEVCTWSE